AAPGSVSMQKGVAPAQVSVHEPQVAGRLRSASHPSLSTPLQSAKPGSQRSTQRPVSQALAPLSGEARQALPHAPQFSMSASSAKSSSISPSQSSSRALHDSASTTQPPSPPAIASPPPSNRLTAAGS